MALAVASAPSSLNICRWNLCSEALSLNLRRVLIPRPVLSDDPLQVKESGLPPLPQRHCTWVCFPGKSALGLLDGFILYNIHFIPAKLLQLNNSIIHIYHLKRPLVTFPIPLLKQGNDSAVEISHSRFLKSAHLSPDTNEAALNAFQLCL